MRSVLTATLIFVATGAAAQAQLTPPAAGTKAKQVKTVPSRPAVQKPADTANAMPQAERQAIQSDLVWVGQYNGAISGDVSERMVEAIKEYQKVLGDKPTGVLNPKERSVLAETARRRQDSAGWKIVTDAVTGARLGIPTRLVPQQTSDASGTKWSSATGTIQIQLSRRKEANPSTARLAEREKKEPGGRNVDYAVVKPDFFVLSGLQGLKKFYLRGTFQGDEVRILTILYDQATENIVEPVVIAMSSAFNPFPVNAGPPPRKSVEYGTGVIVSDDGAVIADPQRQGGANAASSARASVTPIGNELALSPPPAGGFSGAAALDADGKFSGIALLKLVTVAGTASAPPPAQAVLIPAQIVREFAKANGVNATGGSTDAKASVVRVICVRK